MSDTKKLAEKIIRSNLSEELVPVGYSELDPAVRTILSRVSKDLNTAAALLSKKVVSIDSAAYRRFTSGAHEQVLKALKIINLVND